MSHLTREEEDALIEALRSQKVHPNGYALNEDDEPLIIEDGLNEHARELERLMMVAMPWEATQEDVSFRLARVMQFIAAGEPCERTNIADQAIVSFIHNTWQERFNAQFAELFTTYVRHGYIRPNELIRTNTEPGMYRRLHEKLPLRAATHRGRIDVAVLLIENGAVADADFFEWAAAHAGCELQSQTEDWRAGATAQLMEATMRVRISANAIQPCVETAPPARRARAV